MKLYTKTGDDGSTGLSDGQRVGKDHLRVEAYGAVDELNSALGLAAAACDRPALATILSHLQNQLFELGADLASPQAGSKGALPNRVSEIEHTIDQISEPLPPLKQFVLPGGCELAARLHLARTACRLAERRAITLSRHEPVPAHRLIYLNRLSDLLFAMARRANQLAGVQDIPWSKPGDPTDTN